MDETHGAPGLQQLREELLARLWAMQTISPSTLTGTVRRETAQHLDAASDRWWRMLRDADPTTRRQAAAIIERILWPAFSCPADEWWTTPLGAALWAVRAEHATSSTADVMPNRRLNTPALALVQ
jgi:hypothetical protein